MTAAVAPLVITCRALEPSFRTHMSTATELEAYDISLHVRPDNLRKTLQEAIDRADGRYDPIYLGYGLCSQSIVGLSARASRLVVFSTDDCIGIFMGDHKKQKEHALTHPGSYFLCRGWIGDGTGSVFDEHELMNERYGKERADKLMKKLLAHYTRLVHIVMPAAETLEADRAYAMEKAERYDLEYVEIEGTEILIEQMLANRYSSNIIRFNPGQRIELDEIIKCKCPMEVA